MHKPAHVIEIFLQPGEFYFGGQDTRIRTLLGSCVAITMWHPKRLIGGMCHFMLPSRIVRPADELDGRYADEAMALFHREIRRLGMQPEEFQVKLFGGGNMFNLPTRCRQKDDCNNVACRNIMAARKILENHGHKVIAEHVGMQGHRNVMLDIWSGKVWMRHVENALPQTGMNNFEENQCINS
ncbi:MAG: chemotaxis protein CheD [Burkholderiales bacterium]